MKRLSGKLWRTVASVGVVVVLSASVVPAAQAATGGAPARQDQSDAAPLWFLISAYSSYPECDAAGFAGILNGSWSQYTCQYGSGWWWLYVQ